ncbi:MAG: hypothetical protein Q8T11_06930 [Elusimicrobiota bacterium]|nr:hypothetical protein [Elusimicrobiota bacterium]
MKPLNPIMAVLAIASVGVFPLRALAADGSKPAGVVIEEAETSSVDALTKILKEKPEARVDAGKRISEFLLEEFSLKSSPAKKSFVGDVDAETRRLIGVVANEWGAKQGDPADVAVFYFVIGPGAAAPSWAPATFKPGMKWLGKVRFLLSDPDEGDWAGKSQIGGTTYKDQVTAFLNAAVGKSWSALDPRTQGETVTSVEGNNNTQVDPPSTTRTGVGGAAQQQYTLNDLYVDGAKVGNVHGAKDEHSRTISLKIYSKWVDGVIVNEVGVFDITDVNAKPPDLFGRRFPLGKGDQSFILDDRTPGHKKYHLKFGRPDANGDRTIILSRPGEGGAPLETSVKKLFEKRAEQASTMNNIVKVGAQEFYVLPQGGARSGVAFFSKKLIDGGSADPTLLEPTLFAEVGKRGPNGRNQNLPGKPHLGKVGKDEFHLEFNEDLGLWEVKEGAGDPPAPPATPTTGDGTGPGGANPGGPNPGPVPEGGYTFREFVRTFLAGDIASGKCKINDADMKDLSRDLHDRYGVVACNDERKGPHAIVIVPKTAATPDQQLEYKSIPGTATAPAYRFVRVRFFDHYLVLEFDKQVQYLDLLKQGKDGGFALAGFVADRNGSKFTDAKAYVDALGRYMGTGVPAAALTEVPRRIQAALGNKPYYVTGGFADGVLTVHVQSGGGSFIVWPEVTYPGAAPDATPNPYSSLSGPANVMDGSVSSVPEKFKPEFDTADKRNAKLIGDLKDAESKGIALYEAEDPIAKDTDKKYYLTFRYKAKDPTEAKVFQMKPFEVFNSTSPHPGASLVLHGLADGPAVDDRVASGYKFVPGSTKARGVLAVFQNKQVSAPNAKKGAANCVGPVLWWGLSGRPAALKACEEDKF